MPSNLLSAATREKLFLDYSTLKHSAPKGVYVAPSPDEPGVQWTGVVVLRKGPYTNGVLRFNIAFPPDYPSRPPTVSFTTDVFHPLVTPLTTYSHSTRDTGADTASAGDQERLPPGGLSLRYGFPEWFEDGRDVGQKELGESGSQQDAVRTRRPVPMTVEVLQYLRTVFDTEAVLDAVPLEAAANAGAWHAWRSYRAKTGGGGTASPSTAARPQNNASDSNPERSLSPRQQQPGGARRPGEWNWQGVWEERVRKSVQASNSESVLYGDGASDVMCFSKADKAVAERLASSMEQQVT